MGGTSSSRQSCQPAARTKMRNIRNAGNEKMLERYGSSPQEIPGVQSPEKGIQTLPEEILVHIFSYLTYAELCKYVVPVCKYWYDLSKEPSLWLHLSLKLSKWETTANIRNRWNFVRKLDIYGMNQVTILHRTQLETDFLLPRETVLNHKFVNFSDVFITNLASISPLLESLTINCCKYIELEPGSTRSWAYGLSQLKNLKHLEVTFTTCDVKDVDVIVNTCLNLQTLILEPVFVSNQNLKNIALNLKDKLQVLSISIPPATAEGFAALASCLHLKEITLNSAVNINDTVLDALINLPLREVSIFFYPYYQGVQTLTAVSTKCFIRFFSNPKRVLLKKVLFDGFCNFDDTVILSIANNCHQLVDLAFPRCRRVTDDGLVKLLQKTAKLERLNVEETKISQDVIAPFGIKLYICSSKNNKTFQNTIKNSRFM